MYSYPYSLRGRCVMSKHRDPKTVMMYDHGWENLDQSAVNFLGYDQE